ncbi:PREDICTED: cuticle protein 67, isoform A-like [Ceratosolen solmsi marchali]|uniref:Cuticle protein 67, isoform A-like n=1 Tax=Ceratosolen solmsi marchali TaxID=326594 RepID=A0AAJ6YN54_9HYME|nr:PREDICTED: cuticle protein 67, isoform A-like [Ceratosolen solmsi marchali]
MYAKIAVLSCVLALARAGAIGVATYAAPAVATYAAPAYTSYSAPAYTSYSAPALTATSENVYRSAGNLQSISTQSRSIATPFSSSNKQFTSVTNPGVYAHVAPVAYAAAPQLAYAAAPQLAHAAPLAYSAPAVAHAAPAVAHGSSLLGVAYSPAVAVSHMTYSSPVGINYSY